MVGDDFFEDSREIIGIVCSEAEEADDEAGERRDRDPVSLSIVPLTILVLVTQTS